MNGGMVIFRNEKYFARFYVKLKTFAYFNFYSDQSLLLSFHLSLSP